MAARNASGTKSILTDHAAADLGSSESSIDRREQILQAAQKLFTSELFY